MPVPVAVDEELVSDNVEEVVEGIEVDVAIEVVVVEGDVRVDVEVVV